MWPLRSAAGQRIPERDAGPGEAPLWAPAGTAYGNRRQGRCHAACLSAATSRSQETRVFESPGVFELGVSWSTISPFQSNSIRDPDPPARQRVPAGARLARRWAKRVLALMSCDHDPGRDSRLRATGLGLRRDPISELLSALSAELSQLGSRWHLFGAQAVVLWG